MFPCTNGSRGISGCLEYVKIAFSENGPQASPVRTQTVSRKHVITIVARVWKDFLLESGTLIFVIGWRSECTPVAGTQESFGTGFALHVRAALFAILQKLNGDSFYACPGRLCDCDSRINAKRREVTLHGT